MFRARTHSLCLVAAAACWGVAAVISKRAVDEIAPLTLLPIELAVSVAVLALGLAVTRQRVSWSPGLRRLASLGVLNPGLSYALSLAGLARITASVSVLLWAIEPLLILALAYLLLKERVSIPIVACAVAALLGVSLVVFKPGNDATAVGVLLTVGGVGACAIYTVLASKYLDESSPLSVVFVQQLVAFVFSLALLLVSLVVSSPISLTHVSRTGWLSAIAAGVLYYAAAFWFYVTGLKGVPASHAGLFINLVPVFGLSAGYIALHERLLARQWIGAVLIVTAVVAIVALQVRSPTPRTPSDRDAARPASS